MSDFTKAIGHCAEGLKGLAEQGANAAVIGAKWTARAAVAAGNWGARTAVAGAGYAAEGAKHVAKVSVPFFAKLAEFLKNHKPEVIIAAVGVATGAALLAAYRRVCGSN
jgi:hypothetical protein